MTGLHTGHTPIRGNQEVRPEGQWPLPASSHTLAEGLKEAGYVTGAFGKWGLGYPGSEGDPLNQGFDRFFGTVCCPTTDWLYAYIEHNRVPVPPVGMIDKSPYPKNAYTNDFRPGWAAENFDASEVDMVFLEKSRAFMREHVKANPGKPLFLFHSMQAVHLPSIPAKQFRGKTEAGPHGDFIHQMDWIVGALMDELDGLGIADNTLVIFCSDNGPVLDDGKRPEVAEMASEASSIHRPVSRSSAWMPSITVPARLKASACHTGCRG